MRILDQDYFAQYYELADSTAYAEASHSAWLPRSVDTRGVDLTDPEAGRASRCALIDELQEQGVCIVKFDHDAGYEAVLAWQQAALGPSLPDSTGKAFSKIRAMQGGKYFASTSRGQPLHSDDAHLASTPRLISLYCQTQSTRGGLTTLSPLHTWLCEQAAEDRIPRACFAADALVLEGAGGELTRPLLVKGDGPLCAFPSILRHVRGDVAVIDFFKQIMCWAHEPVHQVRFRLRVGQLLVLDNYRWLHGRTSFEKEDERLLYRASFDGRTLISARASHRAV